MNKRLNKTIYVLAALISVFALCLLFSLYTCKDADMAVESDESDRLLLMLEGVLQGEMSKYGVSYEAEGVFVDAGLMEKDYFGLFTGNYREKKFKIYLNNTDAYLFLPGASFKDCSYYDRDAFLDFEFDRELLSEIISSGRRGDIPLKVTFFGEAEKAAGSGSRNILLHVIPSIGFNTLYVDTKSGSIDFVNEKKGNTEQASLEFYDSKGSLLFKNNGNIRSRGNTSFTRSIKKSYRVKLDKKCQLPEIGERSAFIMQANSLDEANCRNAFARRIAEVLKMPYTPQLSFCEVYINGGYSGIYTINDSVKNSLPKDISALFELCDSEREPDGKTVITAEDDNNYIFEGKDTDNGTILLNNALDKLNNCSDYGILKSMVDLESFADMYILNFLTGEKDINRFSTFYYTDAAGHFCAGPVWDMDRAFGNATGAFCVFVNPYKDGYPESLMRFPEFKRLVTDRYRLARKELFELSDTAMDGYMQLLSPGWDRERHFIRKYGTFDSQTYEEALLKVKDYYLGRLSVLDGYLLPDGENDYIELKAGNTDNMRGVYVKKGETVPGEVYDALSELYEDVGVYRADDGNGIIPTGKIKD